MRSVGQAVQNLTLTHDLDLDPITFIRELDLDIALTYLHTNNEVPRKRHSKVIARTDTQTHRRITDKHTDGSAKKDIAG